ncbi:MAG: hypothetical protein U5N86_02865, partial [Planctomycetota bacterium]|nr:hypothetical protein [Planctomycetota bacterium]
FLGVLGSFRVALRPAFPLAQVVADLGRWRAGDALDEVERLCRREGIVVGELSEAYLELGRLSKAVMWLENSVEYAPHLAARRCRSFAHSAQLRELNVLPLLLTSHLPPVAKLYFALEYEDMSSLDVLIKQVSKENPKSPYAVVATYRALMKRGLQATVPLQVLASNVAVEGVSADWLGNLGLIAVARAAVAGSDLTPAEMDGHVRSLCNVLVGEDAASVRYLSRYVTIAGSNSVMLENILGVFADAVERDEQELPVWVADEVTSLARRVLDGADKPEPELLEALAVSLKSVADSYDRHAGLYFVAGEMFLKLEDRKRARACLEAAHVFAEGELRSHIEKLLLSMD